MLADWWLETRNTVLEDIRRALDSIVLLVTWVIWMERNGRSFNNTAKTTTQVVDTVIEELDTYINLQTTVTQVMYLSSIPNINLQKLSKLEHTPIRSYS